LIFNLDDLRFISLVSNYFGARLYFSGDVTTLHPEDAVRDVLSVGVVVLSATLKAV